jgi:hypothetical protein
VTEERRRNAWERLGGSALSISVVDGKIALDASDIGYTGKERTALGRINVPGKPKAALYHGEWFTLRAQDSVKLDIIMGDEGGIFSAAIMIEKEGTTYARTGGGMPLLPVLTVADMEDKEKALYPFIPPEFLQRSVFLAEKQSMLGSGWRID